MQIQIKLKGTTVTVHPLDPEVTGVGNQSLEWQAHDNSDQFNFDNPPITFQQNAPISGISGSGNTASATDNVTVSADFTYQVHLIDSQGNHITYPSSGTDSTTQARMMLGTGTDPTIKNRPV